MGVTLRVFIAVRLLLLVDRAVRRALCKFHRISHSTRAPVTELVLLWLGGASDSTYRQRLALNFKAAVAGLKDAANSVQILWQGHASTLRTRMGNPSAVCSVLRTLAKKGRHCDRRPALQCSSVESRLSHQMRRDEAMPT